MKINDRCSCEQSLLGVELLEKCLEFWSDRGIWPSEDLVNDVVKYIEWSRKPGQEWEELELRSLYE
jgi:hypothetical protein